MQASKGRSAEASTQARSVTGTWISVYLRNTSPGVSSWELNLACDHISSCQRGASHLKCDVCLRPNLGWRDLKVWLFVYKIHTDQFFTFLSLVTRQTLTYWLVYPDDALSSILTIKIIARAGTREDHGRRELAEQATKEQGENKEIRFSWTASVRWELAALLVTVKVYFHFYLYPSGQVHV